jgi:hypothetical protein
MKGRTLAQQSNKSLRLLTFFRIALSIRSDSEQALDITYVMLRLVFFAQHTEWSLLNLLKREDNTVSKLNNYSNVLRP